MIVKRIYSKDIGSSEEKKIKGLKQEDAEEEEREREGGKGEVSASMRGRTLVSPKRFDTKLS